MDPETSSPSADLSGEAPQSSLQSFDWIEEVQAEIAKVVVGQKRLVKRLMIGLLAGGHVLLEGVPGVAKTLTVSALAEALGLSFHRIQFTPDLLPADVTGTLVLDQPSGQFSMRRGPIFAQVVLADEINRAPAKVQSALLEAMQEHQVSIGEKSFELDDPFLVLATQNPLEHEGTYPLPEAQLDRFLLKVKVDYPSRDEEREILKRMGMTSPPKPSRGEVGPEIIRETRGQVDRVFVDDAIDEYILDIVRASREPGEGPLQELKRWIRYGASPRGTISLRLAAKAHALLEGRDYVAPRDVQEVARDVLRHRLFLSYDAIATGMSADDVLERLLEHVGEP